MPNGDHIRTSSGDKLGEERMYKNPAWDFLLQVTVEASVMNIHLMSGPVTGGYNGKQGPDSDHFCDGSKGIAKVNACSLSVAKNYQADFISFYSVVCLMFDSIYPLTTKCPFARGKEVKIQVSFFSKTSISLRIAERHFG